MWFTEFTLKVSLVSLVSFPRLPSILASDSFTEHFRFHGRFPKTECVFPIMLLFISLSLALGLTV